MGNLEDTPTSTSSSTQNVRTNYSWRHYGGMENREQGYVVRTRTTSCRRLHDYQHLYQVLHRRQSVLSALRPSTQALLFVVRTLPHQGSTRARQLHHAGPAEQHTGKQVPHLATTTLPRDAARRHPDFRRIYRGQATRQENPWSARSISSQLETIRHQSSYLGATRRTTATMR